MVDSVIISDKWALDAKVGIQFQTTIIPLLGNYEDRNQDFPTGFFTYEIELRNRPLSEIVEFETLLMGRRGAARTFLIKHPLYGTLTDTNIGAGDGSTATFQIYSTHSDSVNPYYHPWYSIVGLVVKVDGVTKTLTTHYTESNGLITFTGGNIPTGGSPAQQVTVSGTVYSRVRFAEDYNPISFPIAPGFSTPFASAGPFVLIEKPA
jgi:uncharacterized protein (TIGR02217 family)